MINSILHPIEKKIIAVLKTKKQLIFDELLNNTKLSSDQLRRGIEWLKLKNYVTVIYEKKYFISLSVIGFDVKKNGLPERKLLRLIRQKPSDINTLQNILKHDFNIAIAYAKKNNWIRIIKNLKSNNIVSKINIPKITPIEKLLLYIDDKKIDEEKIIDKQLLTIIKQRKFVKSHILKSEIISINSDLKIKPITLNDISSSSRPIDVEAQAPSSYIARLHPLQIIINEIREILIGLGFSEIIGNFIQPSFWNFDILMTPQDHPARDLQDTFYLNRTSEKFNSKHIKYISNIHKKYWNYDWNALKAKELTLRTHTTCITIKHLFDNNIKNDCNIFSLGRVFRNEKQNYKHLMEFHQVEGLVIGKHLTLRDLMGIQTKLFAKIGLKKIKFWPTFFPYTEPSLQTMVYNKTLNKWIELFGMGIIRPEIIKPLGISTPVLAFGGGIERIAMLKYQISDVREFYNNDLNLLRNIKCL